MPTGRTPFRADLEYQCNSGRLTGLRPSQFPNALCQGGIEVEQRLESYVRHEPCNFGSDPIPLRSEVVIGWRIADGQLESNLPVRSERGKVRNRRSTVVTRAIDERVKLPLFGNCRSASQWPAIPL